MESKRLGLGSTCVRLLERLIDVKRDNVATMVIVETGTLRDKEHEPGWANEERSTLAIAQCIEANDRKFQFWPRFYSIDKSHGNIVISREVLTDAKLLKHVTYKEGESIDELKDLHSQIDFALLDSDTDPDIILAEFKFVHKVMRWPGIVVVDDVYDKDNVNKGAKVLPYASVHKIQERRIGHAAVFAFGASAERIIQEISQELV